MSNEGPRQRHQVRRPGKVDDAEHIATAKRMKADGHTGKDIAKYLGVSRATLVSVPHRGRRCLIGRNVEVGRRSRTSPTSSLVVMTALGDLLGRLDPDPGRRGRQFERICQWFLTHDPVYAHELRRVWLWDEWPGRWGADAGIDLVAEDRRRTPVGDPGQGV